MLGGGIRLHMLSSKPLPMAWAMGVKQGKQSSEQFASFTAGRKVLTFTLWGLVASPTQPVAEEEDTDSSCARAGLGCMLGINSSQRE